MILDLPNGVLSFIRSQGYFVRVSENDESIKYEDKKKYVLDVTYGISMLIFLGLTVFVSIYFLVFIGLGTMLYAYKKTEFKHPVVQVSIDKYDEYLCITTRNGNIKEIPFENIQDFKVESQKIFSLSALFSPSRSLYLRRIVLVTTRNFEMLEVVAFKTTEGEYEREIKQLLKYFQMTTV